MKVKQSIEEFRIPPGKPFALMTLIRHSKASTARATLCARRKNFARRWANCSRNFLQSANAHC